MPKSKRKPVVDQVVRDDGTRIIRTKTGDTTTWAMVVTSQDKDVVNRLIYEGPAESFDAQAYRDYQQKQAQRAQASVENRQDQTARRDENRIKWMERMKADHPGWTLRRILISKLVKDCDIDRVGEREKRCPAEEQLINRTYQQYYRLWKKRPR